MVILSFHSLILYYYHRNVESQEWDGYGVSILKDGTKYEGMWKAGRPTGKGREIVANGNSYQGLIYNFF